MAVACVRFLDLVIDLKTLGSDRLNIIEGLIGRYRRDGSQIDGQVVVVEIEQLFTLFRCDGALELIPKTR